MSTVAATAGDAPRPVSEAGAAGRFLFIASIVLLCAWVLVPIYLLCREGIRRYRATWGARLEQTRALQWLRASKVYNWYRLFRPE